MSGSILASLHIKTSQFVYPLVHSDPNQLCISTTHIQGRPELYGSCEEIVSQGIDPKFLLGIIKDDEGEEDKDWATHDLELTGDKVLAFRCTSNI